MIDGTAINNTAGSLQASPIDHHVDVRSDTQSQKSRFTELIAFFHVGEYRSQRNSGKCERFVTIVLSIECWSTARFPLKRSIHSLSSPEET